MSYIDNNLLPGETILYRTKKHYIIFLLPVFWTIVTLFFLLNSNPILNHIAIAPALVALFSWGNAALNYVTSDFAVTNMRVMLREGFFYRHTNETRLSTISNISVDQSLLGQFLGYGTVFINTFGAENDPFTQLASPVAFQKQVQMQLMNKGTPTSSLAS